MNPLHALERPLLVYDGACGFCRRYIDRFAVLARGRVDIAPNHEAAAVHDLPLEATQRAVQYLDPDVGRSEGAEAIFRSLAAVGRPAGLWAYERLPGFAPAMRAGYWLVARTRRATSKTLTLLHDRDLREDPWTLTRALYLRVLGLVLLLAITSYWSQLQALNGAEGILPAQDLVERIDRVAQSRGWSTWERVKALPSLYALSPSDATLHGLAGLATLGALCLLLGLIPGPALLMVLLAWSSIVAVGGVFTGYQWDIFNIEVCVASLFVAPWRLRPGCTTGRRASVGGRWLLRIVLFKFMLLQGLVKWQSGDAPWEELTALQFHFWTQPIPHGVSWYAHHLPPWLLEAGVIGMFIVELILPFFIFGTRRMRQVACAGFVGLMLAIMATGNYGTFNLLTLALCVTLLDDGALRHLVPSPWRDGVVDTRALRHDPAHLALRLPRWPLVALLIGLNLWMSAERAGVPLPESEAMTSLAKQTRQLRISTTYGAFANMTEDRPEVLIEGSRDGKTWTPYPLKYKTLELDRAHGYAASHMPRLDWQLWFAALRRQCQRTRWYLPFVTRVLEGQPDVLDLFAHNPFPDGPPTYIRSTLWSYEFTGTETREASGDVWQREALGSYCPTLTLKAGRLSSAELP